MDLDSDDKVSPAELETSLDRRQRIENARLRMSVTRPADQLFAMLDVEGDGQLSAGKSPVQRRSCSRAIRAMALSTRRTFPIEPWCASSMG